MRDSGKASGTTRLSTSEMTLNFSCRSASVVVDNDGDAFTYSGGKKLRIVTLGLARGDRKWPLNDGQIPHVRGVRAALGTGYNRVEGNRRASRNGRERPPTRKSLTLRFATFQSLYHLDEPRLEAVVHDHVEAVQLEAVPVGDHHRLHQSDAG